MRSDVYELVALGMRYWFVFLGIVILLRAARWAMQEHRAYRRTLAALPDAGLIGEIVNIETGEAQPLPREGVIGSGRACDVRLRGLRAREVEFILKEGTGVHVMPCHMRHQALLDGQPLDRRRSWALHGSRLSLPGYYMRFRLFAGLDVPSLQQASADEADAVHQGQTADDFDIESLAGYDDFAGILPEEVFQQEQSAAAYAAQQTPQQLVDLQMTWMYAIPPAGDAMPLPHEPTGGVGEQSAPPHGAGWFRRKRRSDRHEPS